MNLKIKRGRNIQVIKDFDLLIVEDNSENPVAVVAQAGPTGIYVVSSIDAGEEEFNRVLRGLGIDKTVIRTDLNAVLKAPEALPALKL